MTAECKRVLKPSGSMWVNLGDKYRDKTLLGLPWRFALGLTDPAAYRDPIDPPPPGGHPRWILRAEVVWSKPNGLPESVTDRVRRSHEQWFHFTREPRYFAAVDEVREPSAPPSSTALRGPTSGLKSNGDRGDLGMGNFMPSPLGKLPGSVWTIPSEPLKVPDWLGVDHFAAFPQEFPRRIILGWSPSGICVECGEGRRPVVAKDLATVDRGAVGSRGTKFSQQSDNRRQGTDPVYGSTTATITGYACACDTPTAPTRPAVVLDPFGGTGTVAMVARALGRYGISFDLSSDYLRLARWRVWKSGHEYKTHAREWAEANDAIVDGKVKVPAKVKRQIEAEMLERQIAGRRLERDAWSAVCRG